MDTEELTPEEQQACRAIVAAVHGGLKQLGVPSTVTITLETLVHYIFKPFGAPDDRTAEVSEELEQLLARRLREFGGLTERN